MSCAIPSIPNSVGEPTPIAKVMMVLAILPRSRVMAPGWVAVVKSSRGDNVFVLLEEADGPLEGGGGGMLGEAVGSLAGEVVGEARGGVVGLPGGSGDFEGADVGETVGGTTGFCVGLPGSRGDFDGGKVGGA
eukprot:Hpha_TRINITY_DN16191_c7_g2::TRINITY_DN16191_c7_g2_i3::g.4990::m.4990